MLGRTKPRRGRARYAIVALLGLLSAACPNGRAAEVEYLDTQILHVDEKHVAVRAGIEIRGGQQKWFRVYFQVLRDRKTPLALPDGKAFLAHWADLFPPVGIANAPYTDLRMPLPRTQIAAAAESLPKGKQTVLWVVCAVWDAQERKFLGSGWPVRSALLVTTSPAGKITAVEAFSLRSARPRANDPATTIKAVKCTLDTRHLKLQPGVALYKAAYADPSKAARPAEYLLIGPEYQAGLFSPDRGPFFDRIDTPKKALELALLDWGGSVLIKTARQYQDIARSLASKGWPTQYLKAKPPFVGTDVEEVAGLGYRVRATLIAHDPEHKLLRSLLLLECRVSPDGRFTSKVTELIKAPSLSLPAGAPKPGQPKIAMKAKPYDELVRGLLTEIGSQRLPEYVVATGDVASIPLSKGRDPSQFKAPD